ncbi:hypothetical protein C3B59_05125 [Cryobacterium zongtaii]|uniref:Polysaccharide biosynthesis protein C-terminal domain-containing protein n=1 Tax=Cryobacterium zongtaii TaxID=1259217 RepID=A0A2S3ZMU6_9MICO|nr:hypothetical protein [Cryobacterium zongtaii]POH69728.1 hypothetical protein C3B59_05125 [Cryobacterium zongtaii]
MNVGAGARGLRKLSGFVLIPMLSLVSPLFAFPAITSQYGASGWAAIAIGQSFGSTAAIVVELGWGLSGPQRLARMRDSNRRQLFATALRSKLVTVLPLALAAAVVAYLVSPAFQLESALTAIGATAFGLTASWYFIGAGAPFKLFVLDAIPRLVGVLFAASAMILGAGLMVYPIAGLLLPSFLATVLATSHLKVGRKDWQLARRIGTVLVLKTQWYAVVARATSSIYISLPAGLVAIVAPDAVVIFTAADRLQRMYLSVLAAVPNALQGWVGRPVTQSDRMARASRAILWNAIFGVLVGAAFAAAVPYASELIFSGVATVAPEIGVLSGCLIAVVCTSRATGNLGLVAARRIGFITTSAIVGSLVGLPMILLLSFHFGVVGALVGAISAELAVLAVQVLGLVRAKSETKRVRQRASGENHDLTRERMS